MKVPARPPRTTSPPMHLLRDGLLIRAMDASRPSTDEYLPWDRIRWQTPPLGLSPEDWWWVVRFQRRTLFLRPLPLTAADGTAFSYGLPDELLRLVDRISRAAGGIVTAPEPITDAQTRDRYLMSSLVDEAIRSSQLEGATTVYGVAKEMIRTGRPPTTVAERMILNNFRALEFVRERRHEPLTPAFLRELHAVVTDGTLKRPADAGRVQIPSDERVVVESIEGEVLFTPPPADQLPSRLDALCRFANGDGPWMPAVLRAITIHFTVAHDHYFVDGNGRTARALYYWSMLRDGLWLTEFTSISRILRNAPVQYAHSFLNSEFDEYDLTHFFRYHLQVIARTFDDLATYLNRKTAEMAETRRRLTDRDAEFNARQLALLRSAMRNPHQRYTAHSHAASHRVTTQTARTDLLDLEARHLLVRLPSRRPYVWKPAPDIGERTGAG